MDTDALLLWGFLILLMVMVMTLTGLLIHSGLLTAVDVKTCKPDVGEIKIAYKFARGPYKESGMLYTQVHTLLPQYRTIGVYYDDPKTKQQHKLRYIVGIIIGENGSITPQEDVKLLEEHGYHFATFPAIDHAVQTRFPFKSTISIIVAIMKVYPAIREYIEARSLCARPFLEVYDNQKQEIIFIGPLAQQDDFYVPEVQQEEEEDNRYDDFDDDRTENSSRSWDESASFVKGHEVNDSECSESVGGDDVGSFARPFPPQPANEDITPEPTSSLQHRAQLEPSAALQPNVIAQSDHGMNDSECSDSMEDDNSRPPSNLIPQPTPPPPQSNSSQSDSFLLSQPVIVSQADASNVLEGAMATPVMVSAPAAVVAPVVTTAQSAFAVPVVTTPPVPLVAPEVPGVAIAHVPIDPVPVVDVGESVESGSLGGTESDANTASSFEEIDEREAASIPELDHLSDGQGASQKKEEDEGER